MPEKYNYNQQMNIKYDHLELVDVPAIVAENKEKWFNQTLTKINDSVAHASELLKVNTIGINMTTMMNSFCAGRVNCYVDLEDKTFELNPSAGCNCYQRRRCIARGRLKKP